MPIKIYDVQAMFPWIQPFVANYADRITMTLHVKKLRQRGDIHQRHWELTIDIITHHNTMVDILYKNFHMPWGLTLKPGGIKIKVMS